MLIAGSIFICFQIFSLKVLSFTSSRAAHENQAASILENFNEHLDEALGSKLKFQPIGKAKDEAKNPDHKVEDEVKMVLGILVTQSEDYKPSDKGTFTCLDTKASIYNNRHFTPLACCNYFDWKFGQYV